MSLDLRFSGNVFAPGRSTFERAVITCPLSVIRGVISSVGRKAKQNMSKHMIDTVFPFLQILRRIRRKTLLHLTV